MEELKTLVDSGMEISQETLMSLASFIDDIKAEMEKIETEKEKEGDPIMTALFGERIQQESKRGEE